MKGKLKKEDNENGTAKVTKKAASNELEELRMELESIKRQNNNLNSQLKGYKDQEEELTMLRKKNKEYEESNQNAFRETMTLKSEMAKLQIIKNQNIGLQSTVESLKETIKEKDEEMDRALEEQN